jgi:hypothetical protein
MQGNFNDQKVNTDALPLSRRPLESVFPLG